MTAIIADPEEWKQEGGLVLYVRSGNEPRNKLEAFLGRRTGTEQVSLDLHLIRRCGREHFGCCLDLGNGDEVVYTSDSASIGDEAPFMADAIFQVLPQLEQIDEYRPFLPELTQYVIDNS